MHCRVECNNVTITQLPYFPTGIPLATGLPDDSVDEPPGSPLSDSTPWHTRERRTALGRPSPWCLCSVCYCPASQAPPTALPYPSRRRLSSPSDSGEYHALPG